MWKACDGMIECRHCNMDFCSDCHQMLVRGELQKKVCGQQHAFVTVPYLKPKQVFKLGEIVVDGKVVTLEQWKADIKNKYNL